MGCRYARHPCAFTQNELTSLSDGRTHPLGCPSVRQRVPNPVGFDSSSPLQPSQSLQSSVAAAFFIIFGSGKPCRLLITIFRKLQLRARSCATWNPVMNQSHKPNCCIRAAVRLRRPQPSSASRAAVRRLGLWTYQIFTEFQAFYDPICKISKV